MATRGLSYFLLIKRRYSEKEASHRHMNQILFAQNVRNNQISDLQNKTIQSQVAESRNKDFIEESKSDQMK